MLIPNHSFATSKRRLPMKPEIAAKVNFGAMGLILGAILAIMTGLKAGYLVSNGAADQMVKSAALKMRVAVCVAQFTNSARYPEKLKELKALSFMERDDFIAKGGWDKMPGEDKASDGVNRACGDRVAELVAK